MIQIHQPLLLWYSFTHHYYYTVSFNTTTIIQFHASWLWYSFMHYYYHSYDTVTPITTTILYSYTHAYSFAHHYRYTATPTTSIIQSPTGVYSPRCSDYTFAYANVLCLQKLMNMYDEIEYIIIVIHSWHHVRCVRDSVDTVCGYTDEVSMGQNMYP